MSDVTVVCVTCGKEKIYPSYEYAKGWTLGKAEYCPNCKPSKPIPRVPNKPAIWYKFHWYICLLRGNRDDTIDPAIEKALTGVISSRRSPPTQSATRRVLALGFGVER